MAGSINKVILVGNLGKDPEIRQTQDGFKIASFSIATSEYWKDKASGERKEKTEWHRIAVMNENLVDVVEKYIKRGTKVYVEGQLQTRKWVDQNGQDRYTTEIILGRYRGELLILDNKSSAGGDSSESLGYSMPSIPSSIDDDVPF
ncbi:MAG: Single-stranded DNA-binding protein [Holosporales bacterium]